jgi:hypothetical protein
MRRAAAISGVQLLHCVSQFLADFVAKVVDDLGED